MKKTIQNTLKHFLRRGIVFKHYLNKIEKTQYYSLSELEDYQLECMKKVVSRAYQRVPFYRKVMDGINFTPDDLHSLDDLKNLPILDKQIIKDNFTDFSSTTHRGLVAKGYTSGTSGDPAQYLRDLRSINYENAFLWRQYRWAKKSLKSKRAVLRGIFVPKREGGQLALWSYSSIDRELSLSSYDMSDVTMEMYVEQIKKHKINDIYAYPSTVYILADFCQRKSIDLTLNAVFTSSEMLLDYQKEKIEQVFQCQVFDWYGGAERVAGIAQCEYGTYHDMMDYSLIEYEDIGNGEFEVIGSNFYNDLMPIIRYRTGDIVTRDDSLECPCGRHFRVIKSIEGRQDDIVVLRDGRRFGRLDHIFKGLTFFKEAQIIQHDYERFEIKVIANSDKNHNSEAELLERLHKFIAREGVVYEICWTEAIGRERREKFKLVKSLLKH